ncbi:MAG: DNA polymerase/3'-5' exonuclease PolX, partial [Candidatus Eisenbacteria bacterium]|nr:DNA polymerase/3'-5' exonuclease PolX [Candidatus Eisenbacteria bacterium]
MTNAEIARVLERIAIRLEIDGANVFRVRAYKEGARIVSELASPVASLAGEPGGLESLKGIGKDLAARIRDLVATGRTDVDDELRAKIPDEVVDFTELQGLGPKRVKTLFEELGIRDRAALEAAAREGRLRDLKGFGEKVEQNVLKAIATASQWTGRMLLASAWPLAHALAERVAAVPGVEQVELAGSFRRRKETVGDVDVLACGGDPETVMEAFATHESVADVLGRGDTKCSVRLETGLQVDLRLVPRESFGAALMYFTGSKEHNIELRRLAIEKGWSLNEYGLTDGDRVVASRTEEEVYAALGLTWIPPELRESRGEVALAAEGRLPELIEITDLRADLHMHTTRSDGKASIDEMVEAARARGHEYIAITEHSKALAMAGGFDAARVRESVREIAAARKKHKGFPILHGLEVDILADGELDLDDETLALLDWVIVSIHSRFEQSPEVATARVLRALENPCVHAMGHPTGRLIGSREPVPFDVEKVAETAARLGVAMEINASPDRLDLSDVNARIAREKGCRFVIDTDAHATGQLDQ